MANESQDFLVKIDEEWYAREYPDVALSGLTPVEHYRKYGILFGRPARPAPVEKSDESTSLPESLLELKRHFIALGVEKGTAKSSSESADEPRVVQKISPEKSPVKEGSIPVEVTKDKGARKVAEKIASGEPKKRSKN